MFRKNYEIVFLGFVIPDKDAESLFQSDSRPAVQTHLFGWNVVKSLKIKHSTILCVSSYPTQSFPKVSAPIFFSKKHQNYQGVDIFTIGHVNLNLVKHISRFVKALSISLYVLSKRKKTSYICHGVHSPYLLVLSILRFFGAKTFVILTDPPGVILKDDSMFSRILKRIDTTLVNLMLRNHAGYLLLSDRFLDKFNIHGRPYICFPGFAPSANNNQDLSSESSDSKALQVKSLRVVYCGSLSFRYGIEELLKAFARSDMEEFDLYLIGKGEATELVEKYSSTFSNIYYIGFMRGPELDANIKKADLLINPRPSQLETSTYSFPSKLLEYLSTGIPVLTTRLPSIPDELKDFFHYIESSEAHEIACGVKNVFSKNYTVLRRDCLIAKKFVLEKYSVKSIGYEIERLISNTKHKG